MSSELPRKITIYLRTAKQAASYLTVSIKKYFVISHVVGTQKNRLLVSTQNMLKLMGKKIFKILRSKILFI